MRIARTFVSLASWGAMLLSCVPLAAQTTGADGIVRTRQQQFQIPFQIDSVRNAADLPIEVQLHVSSDRGANWRLDGRWRKDNQRDLRTRQFTFRAPSDGEYWFKVQTLDRNGQQAPHSGQPDLRIIVDTVQPSLMLHARPHGREIDVTWHFDDPNLDATTFVVQYQVAAGGPWQPVPRASITIPPVDPSQPHRRSGSARWNTAVAQGDVNVMAIVSDRCGNRAVVKQTVHVASASVHAAPQPNPGVSYPPPQPVQPQQPPQQFADGSARWPSGHTAQQPLHDDRRGAELPIQPPPPAREIAGGSRQFNPPLVTPVAESQPGANQQQPKTSDATAEDSFIPPARSAPQAPRHSSHYVNSNSFALDYEIDSEEAAGVARVELWATRDGGDHWQLLTTDNDRRSPVLVTVEQDGPYGFQIVIDDVNGQGDPRPRAGTMPQMSVTIDRQAPLVQLIAADADLTKVPATMRIRWQAHDQQLASRPVSLHFSDRPDGEWFVIADQIDNQGEFVWQLPNVMPPEVYLRLAVRDAAGNVGKTVTATPVVLQRARPRGTLRGIRPASSPGVSVPGLPGTGTPQPAVPEYQAPRSTQAYTPPIN